MGLLGRGIEIKTPEQIERMRVAGLLVGHTLERLREAIRPGITTGELDRIAEEHIRSGGGIPSFLGYSRPPFPASICASVNDEVVHGVPGARELREGDVISIDCGAIVDGWHGDAARTAVVGGDGAARPQDLLLIEATRDALWAGIAAFRPGRGIYELGGAIEDLLTARQQELRYAGGAGEAIELGIVDGYTGHGIGREMHMEPTVFNEHVRPKGPTIRPGATVAIEPMVTLGTHETHELEDDWTVVTDDGSRAAHVEHTVARTPDGLWVLTALDGGRTRLEEAGLPYAPLD